MQENIRLVPTSLKFEFDLVESEDKEFKQEFNTLSLASSDPIGQWLKLAKAKNDTADSDPVVIKLLIELHRKIDKLEKILTDQTTNLIPLNQSTNINAIGFEHIKLDQNLLTQTQQYYGRINLPVFPSREIPIFCTALQDDLAKIDLIHDQDEKDWSAYLVAKEREMIRELRKKSVSSS